MNKCGIYKITNVVNGKVYIGQAVRINKRKNDHYYKLSNDRHDNKHLQSAYNKYGKDNFIFKVILYCEPFELTRYEQNLVDITCNIYNLRKLCTDSNKGLKYSEESKRKMSDGQRNRKPMSIETRTKISLSNMGKIGTMLGKHHSEEARRKMSEARKAYYERKRMGEYEQMQSM